MALLVTAASPRLASAQLRAGQTVASFELNLSNPGARSLGLGGAFAGVADDATAAYSNPAALVTVARPEVSYEYRAGTAAVDLVSWSGNKIPGESDSVVGARFDAARRGYRQIQGGYSFVSGTYATGRWALALYGHRLASLSSVALFERGEVFADSLETHSGVALDVKGVGLSGGLRLSRAVSLGATLVRYDGHARVSEEQRFSGGRIRQQRSATVDDSDLGFTVGVLVNPPSGWSVGAYYRSGPNFTVVEREETPGLRLEQRPGSPLHFPDAFGVGAGYRFNESLLVAGEWSRVVYTNLDRVEELPSAFPDNRLRSRDVDELRLGIEYAILNRSLAPAVRVGIWWDPAHGLRARGQTKSCPGTVSEGELFYECRAAVPLESPEEGEQLVLAVNSNGLRRLFPGGNDDLHFTMGVGLLLGPALQIDTAIDLTERRPVGGGFSYSLSALARF